MTTKDQEPKVDLSNRSIGDWTEEAHNPQPRPGGPRYSDVKVQLTGRDGNAFAIMGAVTAGLRRAGVGGEEIAAYRAESMSSDYDHLLRTAMAWVSVS